MNVEEARALGGKMVAVVRDFTQRALDPLLTTQRDLIARLDAQNARIDKSAEALASAERRLSRHAEHLAHLETRLKALERK